MFTCRNQVVHIKRVHYTVFTWWDSPFLLCSRRNEHKYDCRTARGGREASLTGTEGVKRLQKSDERGFYCLSDSPSRRGDRVRSMSSRGGRGEASLLCVLVKLVEVDGRERLRLRYMQQGVESSNRVCRSARPTQTNRWKPMYYERIRTAMTHFYEWTSEVFASHDDVQREVSVGHRMT